MFASAASSGVENENKISMQIPSDKSFLVNIKILLYFVSMTIEQIKGGFCDIIWLFLYIYISFV
ncbi:hypothetical protein DEHRE_02170 [Dehalobacter restrictus DSM 9455]|uniref:Uncharacterized protein n=1 Tax=Dehalobacter restrictus (strain DSM 9455 / PER-K23) TaxID=871738 RepID=A0ABN4BZX8_DEHRP|nr:hypothetical protein DEHRE_02170 [Dehalobacter restrictus DSM 9455]